MSKKKKRKANPTLALALSAIFPGLGQAYNNQAAKGVAIVAVNLIINILLMTPLQQLIDYGSETPDTPTLIIVGGYAIAGLTLWIYSMFDAKRTAELIKKEETVSNI
ncbi:MAG: DUF5683 domain-containing protein [Deltaproteobacteria bacterium]